MAYIDLPYLMLMGDVYGGSEGVPSLVLVEHILMLMSR